MTRSHVGVLTERGGGGQTSTRPLAQSARPVRTVAVLSGASIHVGP